MKTSLEHEDIQAIATAVIKILRPMLSDNHIAEDVIFDKKGLSEYLKVSESTINKLVSNKQIPFFKIQQGQSGGVRFFKKNIDKWILRHSTPEVNQFTGK